MEAESLYPISVHHGHIIRRLRVNKGLNQQNLGTNVGLSQQSISDYEKKRVIEDEILARFAKYFKIPLEDLKEMEEDHPVFFIENNTITNNDNAVSNQGQGIENNTTINPLDKIVELYERMLKEEKDKNSSLEKRLSALEQKIENK